MIRLLDSFGCATVIDDVAALLCLTSALALLELLGTVDDAPEEGVDGG